MLYTVQELAKIVKAKVLRDNDKKINKICIDSRNCEEGSVFIPIPGENSDGTEYIKSAVERGAVCCIVPKEVEMLENVSYILVEDTLAALQQIATNYRR